MLRISAVEDDRSPWHSKMKPHAVLKPFQLALILAVLSPVEAIAQAEPSDSNRGAAFPSPGSQRGANFPKGVSPTERNSTNWVTSPQEYTQPDTWLRWQGRYPRSRWWYERW
jgi:hypothetical protein